MSTTMITQATAVHTWISFTSERLPTQTESAGSQSTRPVPSSAKNAVA